MENGTITPPRDSQPEIKEVPDDLYRRLCQRTAVPDDEILDCFTYDHRGDHTKKGVFFYQDDDMSTAGGWKPRSRNHVEFMTTDEEYEKVGLFCDFTPRVKKDHMRLQLFVPAPYRPPLRHPNRKDCLQVMSCSRESFESLIKGSGLVTPKAFLKDGLRGLRIIYDPSDILPSLEISTRFKLNEDMALKMVFHLGSRTTKVLWLGLVLDDEAIDQLMDPIDLTDLPRTHPMAMVAAFVLMERSSIDPYIEEQLSNAKDAFDRAVKDPSESNRQALTDLLPRLTNARQLLELWANDVLTIIRFSETLAQKDFWQDTRTQSSEDMTLRLTSDHKDIKTVLEGVTGKAWQQKMALVKLNRNIERWMLEGGWF